MPTEVHGPRRWRLLPAFLAPLAQGCIYFGARVEPPVEQGQGAPATFLRELDGPVPCNLTVEIDGMISSEFQENEFEAPYGRLLLASLGRLGLSTRQARRQDPGLPVLLRVSFREHRRVNVALLVAAVNTAMVFPHWEDIEISGSLSVLVKGKPVKTLRSAATVGYLQCLLLFFPGWGTGELERARHACIDALLERLLECSAAGASRSSPSSG